jgi:hypothetical protein
VELKWILAASFEAAFWVVLSVFLVLRYRYAMEKVTRPFVVFIVLDTIAILSLGVWDFAETGSLSLYTGTLVVLLAYGFTIGKEHMRRLDRWMARTLRPSRRVRTR